MKTGLKNTIFGILIVVLLLPLAQQKLHFIPELPLSGAIEYAPYVNFTFKTWWDGTYQEGKSKYLNDHVGLRTYLIKVNNQFDIDVLNKLHANGVVLGKDNYLFEKGYIDAYCGIGYHGDSAIRHKLIKLKKIQDTLERLGKVLLFVHAPSKAWFYPEQFPKYLKCKQSKTLYKDFVSISDSLGIHNIDFNAMFMKMKDTSKHLLFSKQGIHWSCYGAMLASDSIIKYLTKVTGKDLPKLVFDKMVQSDTPRLEDNDLARGINILKPIAKEEFTYIDVHYEVEKNTEKLNAIYIGDSFFWVIYSQYIPHNFNEDYEFWYYFNSIWYRKGGVEGGCDMKGYNWKASIDHSDVIMLLNTDLNLPNFGSGFVEKAFEYYYPNETPKPVFDFGFY